jgi:hypothetical protein
MFFLNPGATKAAGPTESWDYDTRAKTACCCLRSKI